VTSALRKEQEEEARIYEKMRELRNGLHEADARFNDATRRANETKSQGIYSQSAEELLTKLQQDVRELMNRNDSLENSVSQRMNYFEKMRGWSTSDRPITEDDIRARRLQLREMEEEISVLQERLDSALEKNNNLAVFRQASLMASTKLREKEMEVERLTEEKNKLIRQMEEKEAQMGGAGAAGKRGFKQELLKYGAEVRGKMEPYQRMKAEITALQGELVVLQRTETILKSRDKNLDSFLDELEKKKGVVVRLLSLSLSLSPLTHCCLFFFFSVSVTPVGIP
jgi:intraflagellar transport protein 81